MTSKSKVTPKRQEIIMLYRNRRLNKGEAMKKLGIGKDYHMFNAIYHNCTQEDYKD